MELNTFKLIRKTVNYVSYFYKIKSLNYIDILYKTNKTYFEVILFFKFHRKKCVKTNNIAIGMCLHFSKRNV